LINKAKNDETIQAYINEICKRMPILWIDLFCWTKNPKNVALGKPAVLPFICYEEFQIEFFEEIIKAIDNQYDLLTEKSRDMGASWLHLYALLHKWLWEEGSDFRLGSWKEQFVDQPRVIDTLFEKLRFALEYLPDWMLPAGFSWKDHATFAKLYNPALDNVMVGEAPTENFGSGGRSKAILFDEFAKWDKTPSEAAWTATADVTECRLVVSSVKGTGTKFATLAHGTQEKIKKITLPWTLHPDKARNGYWLDEKGQKHPCEDKQELTRKWYDLRDKHLSGLKGGRVRSIWYDNQSERRSVEDLAQEVDIDYLMGGSPFFDLAELEKQHVWEYFERKSPTGAIPFGKYIRCNLTDIGYNEVRIMERPDGWCNIFELPSPTKQYCLATDSAEGLLKGDEAFTIVRDKWTLNVVAVIHGHYAPEEIAVKSFLLEKLFNEAKNVPENNNMGHTTAKDLEELGSNLYYTMREETRQGKLVTTPKRGFTTSANTTRPDMLNLLEEQIRKQMFQIRYGILIDQCKTMVKNPKKGGKPEADGSFLDDGVIACAICGYVIDQLPYVEPERKVRARFVAQTKRKRQRNAGIRYGVRS